VLGWVPRLDRYGDVSLHRSAVVTAGVVVYRLDDRLFFANAGYVKGRIREALRAAPSVTTALVLDASGMSHVDTAGMDALTDLQSNLGVELYVARARSALEAQLSSVISPDHFHPTVRAAVSAAERRPKAQPA